MSGNTEKLKLLVDEIVLNTTQDLSDIEAFKELKAIAKRNRSLPTDFLAGHVLRIASDMDWPAKRAALDSILKRCQNADREDMRIAKRPLGRSSLGEYRVKSLGTKKPYIIVAEQLFPELIVRCTCPDYLRNSLGVCKHSLCVLQDLFSRADRLRKVVKEQEEKKSGSRLYWHPIRPAIGRADKLEQIVLELPRQKKMPNNLRLLFKKVSIEHETSMQTYALRKVPEQGRQRYELLNQLVRVERQINKRSATPDFTLQALFKDEISMVSASEVGIREIKKSLKSLKKTLYPYQIESVVSLVTRHRLLLADDMGLGKTAQAIASAHVLWSLGKVRRGLIVVPAPLKNQWRNEWQEFSSISIELVDGNQEDRIVQINQCKKGFLIVNYEQVLRDLPALQQWAPDLVVLDEAQRIKNWATKTAMYIKTLCPRYRLVLTGTPLENRLDELASIMDWVDDYALEPKWRLIPWHSSYVDGSTEIKGARNLSTIRERLAPSLMRRTRRGILDQLPSRTDTNVSVEITEEQLLAHDEFRQPIAQLVLKAKKRPLSQKEFIRLMSMLLQQRLICNGMELYQFEGMWGEISTIRNPSADVVKKLASPKLLEFREIIRQLVVEQKRKVIVFSSWRRMIQLAHWAIEGLLNENSFRAVLFTGQERQKRRTQNVIDFHDDPSVPVFFATDAGGVGLNLQRAATCCVNLDLPWNPAVLEQRIGRIYRLGQKKPIDVYNLVSAGGIESRIATVIGNKQALFSGLFDGTSDEVQYGESNGFMNQIERVIEPVKVPDYSNQSYDETIGAEPSEGEESLEVPEDSFIPPSAEGTHEVQDLFAKLNISSDDKGHIHIDAPPEAASTLALMFESMAKMLRR